MVRKAEPIDSITSARLFSSDANVAQPFAPVIGASLPAGVAAFSAL